MFGHTGSNIDMQSDDMGRAATIDKKAVEAHVTAFENAGLDRGAFDSAYAAMKADKSLNAGEVILIAHGYRGGGAKAKTKKAAVDMIERIFVQKVRTVKNNAEAARARPW